MKLNLQKSIYMMGRYFLFGIVIQLLAFNFALAENVNGPSEIIDGVQINVSQGSTADIVVRGQVLDEQGEPLPGATITVEGAPTITGTVTDFEGNYSITVPEDAVLVFSFIGFESTQIPVNNRSQINVTLEVDMSSLDEVIVVGYGTQKRESLTGAISSISSEDIGRVRGGATVSSGLAGKLPGVSFRMPDGRPGAAANIQIRNMGDPLFVIDGIQQDVQQFNNLNPSDIESISVLKDGLPQYTVYGLPMVWSW